MICIHEIIIIVTQHLYHLENDSYKFLVCNVLNSRRIV